MKTKPFPGEENLPSELLDTAPGRPAVLQGGQAPPRSEAVPDGYFAELLEAARGTPAIPERPDSAGAKNARFSGGAGVPQRARDKTLPTGEVLVEPLPIAEVRAHALATANPSREVDLEAFVRNAEGRRAATVPSLRIREAEEGAARGRRRLIGLASGVLLATLGASAVYFFANRNVGLNPAAVATPSASGASSDVSPSAAPAAPAPASPSARASTVVAPPPSSGGSPVVAAVPPRAVAPSAVAVAPAHVAPHASAPGSAAPPAPPRASATASGPVEPVPTSSKMRPF